MARETLAAADLIPGDVVVSHAGPIRAGSEVTGYPYGGPLRQTMLPVLRDGLAITHLVESETQIEIIR